MRKPQPGSYDNCIDQFAHRTMLGMSIGFVAALMLSSRRGAWVGGLIYGAGVGGGSSYFHCKEVIDRLYSKATLEELDAESKSS